MNQQVKAYSRPGEDDECDQGHFEYNGSFAADVEGKPTGEQMEAWAHMMDCFYECLFIVGNQAYPYKRTYEI